MAIVSVTIATEKLTTLISIDQKTSPDWFLPLSWDSNPPLFSLQFSRRAVSSFPPVFRLESPPTKPNRVPGAEHGPALSSIDVKTDLY